MPILLYVFNTIIVIPFMIHVIKTGQDRYWIYILLIAPFIGAVVYFLTIMLPSLRQTRGGYKLEKKLRSALNPHAELKAAFYEYETAKTPINQMRLADAYVNANQPEESLPLYQSALTGIYEHDPNIMLKYAKAAFFAEKPSQCKMILNQLREHNPDYNSPAGHLFYAKALAGCSEINAAKAEFEVLVEYYVGYEAKVSYAEFLIAINEPDKAKAVLEALLQLAKRAKRHVREINADSLKSAKRLLKQLSQN